ncbi:uncharacterized protein BX663DRAFT_432732 [Cokeromyces recurvatus]|uniref:uncharacterized protein n=1 Tax=Cokeromyces recurvatus TaxID=90255 RepID=UPI002220362E|nr:uncharacterized protein BX663DRAFT_432732 [Cokeromyces recurvatus]KAI7903891.1 hypothetical protein BX663DRAFT_432732 [Cokeromyces recurvatus]
MDFIDQKLQSLFAGIPSELHLLTAVEILNNAFSNDDQDYETQENARNALTYLRIKAAKGDIEAKIKLSTILDRKKQDSNLFIQIDKEEANLWARSVFDRRLSAALTPCTSELILLTQQQDNRTSLIERLIERVDHGLQSDPSESLKGKKKLRSLCYLVGILFIDGTAIEQDMTRGMTYLSRASDLGNENAGITLAKILSDPYKYPQHYDMHKSLEIYEAMAERKLKDMRALTDLAHVYYEGTHLIPRDLDKAYHYARRIAESTGEQYCQFIVGDILLSRHDIQQAIFWLTQSAEQGFPMAIETLSRIYFEGSLVERDYEMAHHWCLMGDAIWPSGLGYCQTCLGDMYRQGLGVPKDLIRSFEYYQKAATQQNTPQNYARYMLGEM